MVTLFEDQASLTFDLVINSFSSLNYWYQKMRLPFWFSFEISVFKFSFNSSRSRSDWLFWYSLLCSYAIVVEKPMESENWLKALKGWTEELKAWEWMRRGKRNLQRRLIAARHLSSAFTLLFLSSSSSVPFVLLSSLSSCLPPLP